MSYEKLVFNKGYTWTIDELPSKSIAIDGSVRGALIDNQNKKYSFDHHDNCIRSFTKATCEQVLDSILLGFNPDGYNIYVNDFDSDTFFSIALLLKPELSKNPWFYSLVRTIGLIDALGSSYPLLPEQEEKYDWFRSKFEKFLNIKYNKNEYEKVDLKDFFIKSLDLLFELLEKKDFSYQKPEQIDLVYQIQPDTQNKEWIMVESKSRGMTSYLYNLSYTKFVLWQKLDNGNYSYTIAKKSDFVDFPLTNILKAFAEIENGWSGGSTIGGSPRPNGSSLLPNEVVDIINKHLI